jgi:hypothetical protein
VAQLCVAALDKGWAIAVEPRLDLSHACSPECINIYGLVSNRLEFLPASYPDALEAWDRLDAEWQDYVRLIKRDYQHKLVPW